MQNYWFSASESDIPRLNLQNLYLLVAIRAVHTFLPPTISDFEATTKQNIRLNLIHIYESTVQLQSTRLTPTTGARYL